MYEQEITRMHRTAFIVAIDQSGSMQDETTLYSRLMTKAQAYRWMQAKLGIPASQAHIAKFSHYMCDQLISVCREARQNNRSVA